MSRRSNCSALGLVTLLVGLAGPTNSEAQTTFNACRVPGVGAIYMIGLPGLPTACLDPTHVEFSWAEGGAVPDGSVTEAKLAGDAVTSEKILDGSVDASDIADGTLTGAKLANGAVGSEQIQNNGITSSDLQAGSVGASALGLEVVSVESGWVTEAVHVLNADCPAGKRVVSGGYWLTAMGGGSDIGEFTLSINGPTGPSRWTSVARFPTTTTFDWRVYAVCVSNS